MKLTDEERKNLIECADEAVQRFLDATFPKPTLDPKEAEQAAIAKFISERLKD